MDRVSDGDSLIVSGERVRLIGIDAPELDECHGREAKAALADLVVGERVRLEEDRDPRDRYGRHLAYVYRAADGAFVNARMVSDGHARALVVRPNVRHAAEFARLEAAAADARRGLWAGCPRD